MPVIVGLDVHKRETQACVMSEKGEVLEERRFKTSQASLKRVLGKYENARVVIESVGFHRPVARWIEELDHEVHLANPRGIVKPKVKTDKKDARHLGNLLRVNLLPESWLAPEGVQQLRDLARHRQFLGQETGRIKGRIKHALYKNGHFVDKNPVETKSGREWLRKLAIHEITSMLNLLEALETEQSDAEKRIEAITTTDPNARLLTTIPGVGPFTALVILAEIGDITRFPDAEKLASYAGFSIREEQSGDNDFRGRITKQGDALLRWIMIEAGRNHVRYAPEGRIAKKHEQYRSRKGGAKAKVATARALLHVVYAMLRDKTEFNVNR